MRAAWLLILAFASACRSTDEQWSFAVTRAVVEAGSDSYSGYAGRDAPLSGGPEMFPIVLVPLAVDVVLLPVTLPHDAFFVD